MARKRFLNIGNSDRVLNLNIIHAKDIGDKQKINRLNEDKIEEEMDYLAKRSKRIALKDDTDYLLFQEKYTNDKLISKVIKHGKSVTYYTDTIVPYYILNQLSMNTESEVVYKIKSNFSDTEVENIELASMATRTIVDCPVIFPYTNPVDVKFALHDLKARVDKVHFSFPPLTEQEITEEQLPYYTQGGQEGLFYVNTKHKDLFYRNVERSLSTWKMNIYFVLATDLEYTEMETLLERKHTSRTQKPKKRKKADTDD